MKKIMILCLLSIMFVACDPNAADMGEKDQSNFIAMQFPITADRTFTGKYNGFISGELIYSKIVDDRIKENAIYQFSFRDTLNDRYVNIDSSFWQDEEDNRIPLHAFIVSDGFIEFYTYDTYQDCYELLVWMYLL